MILNIKLPNKFGSWYWLIVPLVVATVGILLDIDLPGLYMDAVNPDYMAAKILGSKALTSIWLMPGNFLFDRFPLLPGLYYGSGMAWLGTPFYALLGMDIFSIRLVHGIYALGVLTSMLFLTRKAGVGSFFLLLIGVTVALDPSFIFSFRTQFYINTTPLIAFLFALCLLESVPEASRPKRTMFFSGVLFGISVYGYFIYAFFFPAVLVAIFTLTSRSTSRAEYKIWVCSWFVGLILGLLPYIVGYILIMRSLGGIGVFFEYFISMQKTLGSASELGRLQAVWTYFLTVSNHTAQSVYWVGSMLPLTGGAYKAVMLLVMPVIIWLIAEWRKTASRWLRLTIGCTFSYFLVALFFGARLGAHHFIPIYLFLHLVLAIALYEISRGWVSNASPFSWHRTRATLLVFSLVIPIGMALQNIHGQMISRAYLRQSGGVLLYSDAITKFSGDILANHRTALHVMPDWGLLMPAVFLTEGKVDIISEENFKHARWMLCTGHPVRWALITGDKSARFEAIAKKLDWSAPKIESWHQRNGPVVFEVGTFLPDVPDAFEKCSSPSVFKFP